MTIFDILHLCLLIVVTAAVLPLVVRKTWLRFCCVAAILLVTIHAAASLWFAAQLVLYRFQSGEMPPGTIPSQPVSYGQMYIHDYITATLPIFVAAIVGLAVLTFVPSNQRNQQTAP